MNRPEPSCTNPDPDDAGGTVPGPGALHGLPDSLAKISANQILPLVYDELRRLAASRIAANHVGSINPTSLVHAAYLRIVGSAASQSPPWNSKGHFFGAAAIAMRRIMVERARERAQLKRGGAWSRVEIRDIADEETDGTVNQGIDILSLDTALVELEALDAEKFRVVMLRYFSGLTVAETAAAMDISPATVKRHWTFARLWLMDRVNQIVRDAPGPAAGDELIADGE